MSVEKKKHKKKKIFLYTPRAYKYLSILHGTSSCAFCITMWKEKYVTSSTKKKAFCYFPYLIALHMFGQFFLELLL